jgi:predicted dehydrogenase
MVADTDQRRLDKATAAYPAIRTTTCAEDLIKDPEVEAVSVATPVDTHFGLAKTALNAGKPVLVEKPFTSTVAQAEELIEIAKKKGVVVMVDHVFVFNPAVQKMKEIVDSGALGELLFVDSVRINLGLYQRDVNVVWDLAPHDLSIVDYVTGRTPRSVATFGAAHAGHDLEDVAYLNLDLGQGLIANFHVNWLSPVKIRYTMLGGRKKSLVYNDLELTEKIKVYDSGIQVSQPDDESKRNLMIDYRTGDIWSPRVALGESLAGVVSHFAECVRENRTPITDGNAGLRVVRILDAAQRSIKAQGGRIVL